MANLNIKYIIIFIIFSSMPVFAVTPMHSERPDSESFPMLHPLTIAQINQQVEQKYKERLATWESMPKLFHKHQVVELVAVNNKYKTFEVKFVNFGKIGTKACIQKVKALVKDKALIAGRCGAEPYPYDRKTNQSGDYNIHDVNNTQGFYNLTNMHVCETDHKKNNYNYVGNPSFNFKKPYCTISLQYRDNSFNRVENEMTRDKRKPSMWRKEETVINAITNRSTIACRTKFFLQVGTQYNHHFSAKRCFKVPANTEMNLSGSITDKDGNTLIKAAVFASNAKNRRAKLYFNASDITISESDSAF